VAGVTGSRETSRRVIGIRRALVVLEVARRACACGQVVITIYVALRALQGRMRASKRKPSRRMVKTRVPICSGMASLASLREACLHVIGTSRALVILQVARHARSAS
jgi:hypothetical protein